MLATAGLSRGAALVRKDATYLVTGGLRGLGLLTAEWLAEQGARHLVLVGRGTPSAEAQAAIDAPARQRRAGHGGERGRIGA